MDKYLPIYECDIQLITGQSGERCERSEDRAQRWIHCGNGEEVGPKAKAWLTGKASRQGRTAQTVLWIGKHPGERRFLRLREPGRAREQQEKRCTPRETAGRKVVRLSRGGRDAAAIGKADRRIVRSERTPGETRGRKTRGATARKEIPFTVIRGDPIAERGRSPSAMPASCQIISSIGNSGETLTTQSQEAKTDAKPEYLGSAEVRPVRPPEI